MLQRVKGDVVVGCPALGLGRVVVGDAGRVYDGASNLFLG